MIGNLKSNKTISGFTLIEIIVALGIFVIVVTLVTEIFTIIMSQQRRAYNIQQIHSDLRYTVEKIAQFIRLSTIDYNICNQSGYCEGEDIYLRDQNLQYIGIKKENDQIKICESSESCILPDAEWEALTSPDYKIVRFNIYYKPTSDPFGTPPSSNYQPRITLVIEADLPQKKLIERERITLQTTITSRVYKR